MLEKMSVQTEFENNFHSISGVKIGERRKHLYALLHNNKIHQTEIDFSAIKPKNALEEVFKVETLIFFRKVDDLLNVLYGENTVLIQRVLNIESWFIIAAFENVNGEDLVTKVFPNISYNTKLKLLSKFIKFLPSVQKSDEYFESIKKTYGLFLAAKLLGSCSQNLILQCLEENKVEITPRQLLTLVKKYPAKTETFFELLEKQEYKKPINEKYKIVFVFLSREHNSLFLKLYDKYKPNIVLGSKTTKKCIAENKDYVVKSSHKIGKILKRKQTYKQLRPIFEEYFYNLLPKSLDRFQENYNDFLSELNIKLLSKPKQLDILVKSFQIAYGSEIWDYPVLLTLKLLEMMSPDDRELWMKDRDKPKGIKEEDWISLMKTEKSIPLLIEKISLTSNTSNREELIKALVNTCHINNDLDALLKVLQYVAKKHRNDDIQIRSQFLYTISETFDCTKFSEEHWTCVMTFVRNFLVDESDGDWAVKNIFDGYIRYSFVNNLETRDIILEWIKNGGGMYSVVWGLPEYEKSFLRTFAEVIPHAFTDGEVIAENYIGYLFGIIRFNNHNRENRMSYFENQPAIQHLKWELGNNPGSHYGNIVIQECLKFEYDKSLEMGLLETYRHAKSSKKQDKIFNLVLKSYPETFIDVVLPYLTKWHFFSFELHFLKYYEHLNIPQQFTDDYVTDENSLKNPDELTRSQMQCLSHTMKPADFLQLASSYYPEDLVASCDTEAERDTYKLQKVLLRCLKNLATLEESLETLMHFCKGDYLKLCQCSLHSICDRVNENKLTKFINILNSRAVSVRKHSIYLTFRLLQKKNIYDFLTKLLETEKNMSTQKTMLKVTFQLFLKTNEDYYFELLKSIIEGINFRDTEVLDIITNDYNQISPKYVKDFIIFIWELLEQQNLSDAIIQGKCRILKSIDENTLGSLPEQFCVQVIEKHLFNSEEFDEFEMIIQEFASKYVIFCNLVDLERHCEFVLAIAQKYVNSNWYKIECHATGRKFISKFVTSFCSNFLSKKCKDVKIMQTFINVWDSLFKLHQTYNEYLCLNFTLIYIKCIEEKHSMLEIGESLGQLCGFLEEKGLFNINVFCNVLETFRTYFESMNEEKDVSESILDIVEGSLKNNSSPSGYMLAIFLLPDATKLTLRAKKRYDNIFYPIINHEDATVQMYLHQHFLKRIL